MQRGPLYTGAAPGWRERGKAYPKKTNQLKGFCVPQELPRSFKRDAPDVVGRKKKLKKKKKKKKKARTKRNNLGRHGVQKKTDTTSFQNKQIVKKRQTVVPDTPRPIRGRIIAMCHGLLETERTTEILP